MKMTLMLCATILFCLPHLSASQTPSVSSSPDDQRAIPDDKKMFACSFIGNSIPHWLITKSDGTFETITSGTMTSMFKLPHISEIVGNGTVSQLEVTAALSLNGSTYMCQIVVAGGTTIDSAAATLTVYGPPEAPTAHNSRVRHNSIRVSWTKPWSSDLAPVNSYVVQLLQGTTVQETDTVDVGMTTTTDREKTFDNLISEREYNARVAAVNSVGQGPWSNIVAFTTLSPKVPPPPEHITVTVAIEGNAARVTVSWTAPMIDLESQTKVTGYTVFHKESSAGDFTEVTLADVTSYTIPTPVPLESTYEIKVAASNSGGASAASASVSRDVEYLRTVSAVGGLKHLDITCTFASSIDIALQCSVELAGPTAMTVTIPKEISSMTAVMMVPGLDAGKYNITAKALRFDGSEASPYTTKQYLIVVTTDATETTEPPTEEPSSDPETPEPPDTSTPEPSATPAPPVAPRGTTFTTQQIGIIAGVVVGVFLALILVPCCIFSCFVIFQK